ncbi:MAG: hypothetical protein D6729_19155 [Deltaproteobacteria bacterium]|nr:MAG: hypothetical protein D6729_19155 [Deltaproteobacteria bacterium]
MSRRGWILLGAFIALLQIPLLHQLFWRAEAKGTVPFEDDFDREEVGEMYSWFFDAEGPRIDSGWLCLGGVKNNPVWLKVPLPRDVRIRFLARSTRRTGDIKFEVFGNGRDHESGYVVILGGWNNTISVLARRDEHGADRKERRDFKVEPGRTYAIRLERRGGRIQVFVDDVLLFDWEDPEPLVGPGHDRFGFSAWETPLCFDELRIEPL